MIFSKFGAIKLLILLGKFDYKNKLILSCIRPDFMTFIYVNKIIWIYHIHIKFMSIFYKCDNDFMMIFSKFDAI